jgi:hypothetical protein
MAKDMGPFCASSAKAVGLITAVLAINAAKLRPLKAGFKRFGRVVDRVEKSVFALCMIGNPDKL